MDASDRSTFWVRLNEVQVFIDAAKSLIDNPENDEYIYHNLLTATGRLKEIVADWDGMIQDKKIQSNSYQFNKPLSLDDLEETPCESCYFSDEATGDCMADETACCSDGVKQPD